MSTNASDGVSFEALFESEFSYVCRTLRRLGVKEADLDDLAQEVFITVHRHLHEYDSSRPLKPWLFSFAFGTAANYRRLARHRAEKHEDSDVHASTAPGPAQQLENAQARDLVLRALSTLDEDRAAVFVMHELDGFAAPDIAESLSIPLNTVYSRLRVARDEFTTAVRRLQKGERS
ncbi:MAG: RNA polymerase sigma factor [Sandaracinaceae bacterium]|nr:RNA polymerase sigma factor [Sandaracinaceae bacterium]